MHRYEKAVLEALRKKHPLSLDELAERSGVGRDGMLWAIENLSKERLVEVSRTESSEAILTDEGAHYAASGLPEARLLKRLKEGTVKVSAMQEPEEQIGFQWAKKNGLVKIVGGNIMLSEKGVTDTEEGIAAEKVLRQLSKDPASYGFLAKNSVEAISELSKRNLIRVRKRSRIKDVSITQRGISADLSGRADEGIGALTKSMIASGEWKGKSFKPYDVNVPVERRVGGRLHPLYRLMEKIRRSYISNGFLEVHGPVIDSAFWVFDALFQPQDHPARDAQDTFYLSGIDEAELGEKDYVRQIKNAHTKGWRYRWSLETAKEMVLRTHTTNVSAHYIYDVFSKIGEESASIATPLKFFSLGKVFRNENIDYRHLADFYMTDGIIIGKDLTLANLFDTILKLYGWLGTEIRFKPAYFPFVEPGVELYAYSNELKEWIEFGGAGLIRKEITGFRRKTMNVLAWGVAVERLMQIRPGCNVRSITELYGNSLEWTRGRGGMNECLL